MIVETQKMYGLPRRRITNYTGTEKKQPCRGSDYTKTDNERTFRGRLYRSSGPMLTSKFVKTVKT